VVKVEHSPGMFADRTDAALRIFVAAAMNSGDIRTRNRIRP
jgi:hypothetical protein